MLPVPARALRRQFTLIAAAVVLLAGFAVATTL
jgi:hypothetical protein